MTMSSDEWYNLALDLEEANATEEAMHFYQKAIIADVDNQAMDAHVNLGRLYQLEGNKLLAESHYESALLVSPDHQLALYNMGTLLDEEEKYDEAMEHYMKATTVKDAYYNMSRICESRGDEFSAHRYMRIYRSMQ